MSKKFRGQPSDGYITPVDKPTGEVRNGWPKTEVRQNDKVIANIFEGHDFETLENVENAREMEARIEEAPFVVLEIAPEAIGLFDDATLNFFAENALYKAGDNEWQPKTKEEWKACFLEAANGAMKFYNELEKLAAKHNKPVAQIGSYHDIDQKIFPGQLLQENERVIPNLKPISVIVYNLLVENIKYKSTASEEKNLTDQKMLSDTDWNWNKSWDYREAVTANGLDVLAKQNESGSPILVIYGGDHIPHIANYCKTPEEGKSKLQTYPTPLQIPKIQIFENADGLWKQRQEIPISPD